MAGEYRYERDGQPTGAVEKWRLTDAAAGYRFLRVDLDARDAVSGHTYLYHALLNAQTQVERLQYRFWTNVSGGLQVTGSVILERDSVLATRTVNGKESEQVLTLPHRYRFWFPSVAGLNFVNGGMKTAVSTSRHHSAKPDSGQGVTLNGQVGDEDTLAVQEVANLNYLPLSTAGMEMEAAGKTHQYSRWRLSWGDGHWRIIMRAADTGWPLGMERDDGLTAVARQYINYH